MSKNNNVYITSTGKKYHFFPSCNYIKGRNYQIIPLNKVLNGSKGPCSSCQRLYEKNGGKIDNNLIYIEEEDKIKENNNINNVKINNEININNINNSKNISNFKIIENEKSLNDININNKNKFKKKLSSSSSNSSKKEKDKKINENFLPFNLDDISGIKTNNHIIDSKIDIDLNKKNYKNKNINNEIINNINNINNDEISDNEEYEDEGKNNDFNIKNSLENMKKLKYDLDPNLPKKDLNWKGKDFVLLEETNKSANLFMFKDINHTHDPFNEKFLILYERKINNNNSFKNGNFKFKFEIEPIKELKEPINISVGYDIDFYDDENGIKKENKKMNSLYKTISIKNHFMVNKKTKNVFVLINIINGKFFVVGSDEIEKRNKKIFLNSENSDILFLENFIGIKLENIKEVRALFQYDIDYLNIANIVVNGANLNEYHLKK